MLTVMGAPGFHSVAAGCQVHVDSAGCREFEPAGRCDSGDSCGRRLVAPATHAAWNLIRAVGENPAAADVAGLQVNRIRLGAAVAAGIFAGLAGAYLSVDWLGQ